MKIQINKQQSQGKTKHERISNQLDGVLPCSDQKTRPANKNEQIKLPKKNERKKKKEGPTTK